MGKVGKVAPIKKEFVDNGFLDIESSLQRSGFARFPGTTRTFLPHKEAGKYRTGLDEHAKYLDKLPKEEKEAEIERIKKDRKRLEEKTGLDLSPKSSYYNFASTVSKEGRPLLDEERVAPVRLGTSIEFFDLSDPYKEITWNWLKVHPGIAPSLEAYMRGECDSSIQYYILDEEIEQRVTFERKRKINDAIAEFVKMTPTKRKQVARLMGLPVTEDTSEELVYNLIDTQLKETEFKSGQYKGMNPVNIFNDIIKLSDDRLKVRDLVEQAITHSVYRMSGYKVFEGSVEIAANKQELIKRLLDDKNQEELLLLERKVKNNKIENE